jgi:hypothetical protein
LRGNDNGAGVHLADLAAYCCRCGS